MWLILPSLSLEGDAAPTGTAPAASVTVASIEATRVTMARERARARGLAIIRSIRSPPMTRRAVRPGRSGPLRTISGLPTIAPRQPRVNDISGGDNGAIRDPVDDRTMALHPAVVERLGRLAPDQRAAATAPPGPSLCIAPAGSGKTTTLVARAAWLIATGTSPGAIRAITFNKRAAVEMTERLDAAVAPLGVVAGAVSVRTFHALGREILRDAGVAVEPMVDRAAVLAEVAPWADEADLLRLDTVVSRLKVELGVTAADVAADEGAGPIARAFVAYEAAVAASGGLDFDDLILRATAELERDTDLSARWRGRCRE